MGSRLPWSQWVVECATGPCGLTLMPRRFIIMTYGLWFSSPKDSTRKLYCHPSSSEWSETLIRSYIFEKSTQLVLQTSDCNITCNCAFLFSPLPTDYMNPWYSLDIYTWSWSLLRRQKLPVFIFSWFLKFTNTYWLDTGSHAWDRAWNICLLRRACHNSRKLLFVPLIANTLTQ